MANEMGPTSENLALAHDLISRACAILQASDRPLVAAQLFYALGLLEEELGSAPTIELAMTQSR
jgi:hypothetical protein